MNIPRTGKIISRFSCGAASAVATKLTIAKYPKVEIYYNDTRSEHPDNKRFMADCERWFGQEIHVLTSTKYADIWEVFERKRFLSSQDGAPCTSELKKLPGLSIWEMGDVEILGFTSEEVSRLNRFLKNNPERIIECPLIDNMLGKADCLGMLERAGIELPAMYKLGFRNNNCIACVKARDSIDYWKRVRLHFPDQFKRMARLERELDFALNRRTKDGVKYDVFLDEIEPGPPQGGDPDIECGLFCMQVENQIKP